MRSLLLLAAAAHAFVPPPHRGFTAPSLRAPQPLREPLPRKPSGVALAASPSGAPRPDPRFDPFVKLILCVAIDLVGASTYAIPAIGEGFDVGWAPVQAALVNYLFGNGLITGFAFLEEILPGTDFIPTATIAWFYENRDTAGGDGPPPPEYAPPATRQPRLQRDSLRDGAIDV